MRTAAWRSSIGITLAAVTLAGCGPSSGTAAPSPSPSATASALTTRPAADGEAAVRRLAGAAGGTYTTTATANGQRLIGSTGSWTREPAAYSTRTTSYGDTPIVIRLVSAGGAMFIQTSAWDKAVRRCWLSLAPAELESLTGLSIPSDQIGIPTAVDIGQRYRVTGPATGEVPLSAALGLVSGKFKTGIDASKVTGMVPAAWGLDGAHLTIVVTGADLAASMKAAGILTAKVGSALAQIDYTVGLPSTTAAPSAITAPSEDLRMTPKQFRAKTC